MPINRDLSALPKADAPGLAVGRPPDPDPWVARALITNAVQEFDRPYAHGIAGRRFRFSDAASCTRELSYKIAGVPESNPLDIPSLWVIGQGQIIGARLQQAALEVFPDADIETVVDGERIGVEGSGHTDITLPDVPGAPNLAWGEGRGMRISIEAKSIGGFGYKLAATTFKGAPQGPRLSAVVQGALNAAAWEADLLMIVYVATEAVGKNLVKAIASGPDADILRVAAQWTYTPEEFRPIAEREVARVNKVLARIDTGEPIPRFIPLDDGTPVQITNPKTGAWVMRDTEGAITGAGEHWKCSYCRFQDRCIDEPEFVVLQTEETTDQGDAHASDRDPGSARAEP